MRSMAATSQRNWASLPPDLICAIAEFLPIPDYFRFRAVCKSYSSSAGIIPIAHNFPWLMLSRCCDDNKADDQLSFFSLAENRQYNISIPSNIGSPIDFVGYQNGWLALVHKDLDSYLLNPITEAQINLPSFSTLPLCSSIHKVVVSPNPFIAVAICGTYGEELAFARPGDESWISLDTHCTEFDCEDVVYHNGNFFAISSLGQIEAFQLTGDSPKASLFWVDIAKDEIMGYPDDVYLVSSSADLLKVTGKRCKQSGKILEFVVMKFDSEVDSCWVEIKDLGDKCLFVGRKNSMMLSAKDFTELRGNCIYFIPEFRLWEDIAAGVGVFDFRTGNISQFFPSAFQSDCQVWRPQLWFMPSLL